MRISKTTLAFLTVGALAAPGVDAATLVVLNKAEATASLIDLDTGKVKKTLPTGDGPHEVAVSPDGTVALVTNYGNSKADGNSLTVKIVSTSAMGSLNKYVKWVSTCPGMSTAGMANPGRDSAASLCTRRN